MTVSAHLMLVDAVDGLAQVAVGLAGRLDLLPWAALDCGCDDAGECLVPARLVHQQALVKPRGLGGLTEPALTPALVSRSTQSIRAAISSYAGFVSAVDAE